MKFQSNIGTVEKARGRWLDAVIAVSERSYEVPLSFYVLLRIEGLWYRLTLDEGSIRSVHYAGPRHERSL